MTDNNQVFVREVGLRDGIQSLDTIATQDKIEWLKVESEAGVRAFEITSFVPAHVIPQFFDAQTMVEQGQLNPRLVLSALVLNEKGAMRALEAGAKNIVFVLSASATHSQKNARTTLENALATVARLIEMVKQQPEPPHITGAIATSFGCTYEGHIESKTVLNIADRMAQAGVDHIALGDTVGFAGPRQIRNLFTQLRQLLGKLPVGAHFHDTRGMGMANVLAALDAGVRHFDASLGGLGGCPFALGATGNIATEDLCFLLEEYGLQTGINLEKLLEARRWLAHLLPDEPLQGALSRAGLPTIITH